ncbi:hypothetical protein A2690_00740 [Candidatus Roizmanbacteria bacterium RIFCSPHIGHO2_01_FULL_39_12b]|uniref:PIN domain-containing protein n=1 Tax=Candidatus Roizmanbacteria bacterium RIFCSPHIGHO2_01_FULL_39_12b TaxID=1802030 RepID=A0A1F7GAS4_9BACT|nr:MAG: hypothetical protein A2690_00740 [Candidatus Roizmanbacteria bacterium RIFCSPHIGHO2_01_FULL_39_12b]OGK46943.1 MAG: hypothetical protein A3B46_03445 [Candidatus Roizmanbacteria bacterium RIFCSPLOWO2_01_FULL_39_19]
MINMHGEESKLAIVDADGLIGLMSKDDKHHSKCIEINNFLNAQGFRLLIPYGIVLEASTAVARAEDPKKPILAHKLLVTFQQASEPSHFDLNVGITVSKLYNPQASAKHTPFDHYVLALAKQNNIRYVFSFDQFYAMNGLVLLEDLL